MYTVSSILISSLSNKHGEIYVWIVHKVVQCIKMNDSSFAIYVHIQGGAFHTVARHNDYKQHA